jgi:hypothetical protein
MSFFTGAQTASMRDRTKRRNYSAEAEKFRGEQSVRRSWGLQQRHAGKMRRLHGSVAAAWTTYQDRVEELRSAAPSAQVGEAGLPASAGAGDVTGAAEALSEPVRSGVAASAQVDNMPLAPETIESSLVTPEPAPAPPVVAGPVAAGPVAAGAPTCEPILSETVSIQTEADLSASVGSDVSGAVVVGPVPAEADLSVPFRPDVSQPVAAGSRPAWRAIGAFGRVSCRSPRSRGAPEPAEHCCPCPVGRPTVLHPADRRATRIGQRRPDRRRPAPSPRRTDRAGPGRLTAASGGPAGIAPWGRRPTASAGGRTLLHLAGQRLLPKSGECCSDRQRRTAPAGGVTSALDIKFPEIEIRFWFSAVLDILTAPDCSVGGILLRM